MTVASQTSRKTFTGDDVTVAFATTPVVFFAETDLLVYVITTATGAAELQTLTTDYTVSGGDGAVGTVTMLTAPASTQTLLIRRSLPMTQSSDFVQNDASDAEVLEEGLDRLTMIAQQLAAGEVSGGYGLRIPSLETPTDALTTLPFDRANKLLGFDASKNLEAVDGGAGSDGAVALAAALAASGGSALIGTVQSGTGAISQTMQAKGRQIVNALDFGTMTTTPGADINLAITALNAASGGDVWVPPGSYQVETSILLKSNVHLRLSPGCILNAKTGLNAPVIKNATSPTSVTVSGITRSSVTATATTSTNHGFATGDWVHITGTDQLFDYEGWKLVTVTGATTFTFECDKDATTPATTASTITCFEQTEQNIGIHGGRIEGNALNTTGANNGVLWNGVQNWRLDDLYVNGTYHTGIAVHGCVNGKAWGCRADNVIHSSHVGMGFGATSPGFLNCDKYSVASCFADYNGQDGFLHQWGSDASYNLAIAIGNVQTGLKLGNGQNVAYAGCIARLNLTGFKAQNIFRNISYTACIGELNNDSGFFASVITTAITCGPLSLVGNQFNNNGNDPTSSSYGIAFDVAAGGTIDVVNIVGNTVRGNTRGVSFNTNGTVSNVAMHCNMGGDNTFDLIDAGSLDTATFTYGLNSFANASGIKLPANSASGINVGNTANTDPEFLDYYKDTQSWTPVLTFATPGDLNVAYAANGQIGRWARVGNLLFLFCHINTSTFTHTTASGNLQITGSPFTSLNVSGLTTVAGVGWRGITKANYTDVITSMAPNSAVVNMAISGSGQTIVAVTAADMPTGGTVDIYFTHIAMVQ